MKLKTICQYYLSLILLVVSIQTAFAQPSFTKDWDARFGGNNYDKLLVMLKTSDNGFLLVGNSQSGISGDKSQPSSFNGIDTWIVKTDALGNKEWDVDFGGWNTDYITDAKQTLDGGYILLGYSATNFDVPCCETGYGPYDIWIVKIDANGNEEWSNSIIGNHSDLGETIYQNDDGSYIIGSSTYSFLGYDKSETNKGISGSDFWIIKVDASGNKIWDKTIGGGNYDYLTCMITAQDGNFIFGGYSYGGIGGDKTQPSQGLSDFWIVKMDPNGNKLWDKTFGGVRKDELENIFEDNNGNLVCTGKSSSKASGDKSQNSFGNYDMWIVKTDANGNKIWDKTFGGSANEYSVTGNALSDGGYTFACTSESGISGNKTVGTHGKADFWVLKTDANGIKEWDADFGGNSTDELSSMVLTSDESFALAGTTTSGIGFDKSQASQGRQDYWLIKISTQALKKGFASAAEPKIILYPNPANEKVTIYLKNQEVAANQVLMQLKTLAGQIIYQETFESTNETLMKDLDTSYLPSGIYQVVIINGSSYQMERFIKQ